MRLIDADRLEPHEQIEPFGNGNYEYVEVVYKDDIDSAPTIEERKKGKWIKCRNEFVCSECGYRSILKPFALVEQDGEMEQVTEMNFCYKCGADMRGDGKRKGSDE